MTTAVMTDGEAALPGRPVAAPRPGRSRALPEIVFLQSDVARMLRVHEATVSRLVATEPQLASCRALRGRAVFTPLDFHRLAWLLRRRT